MHLTFAFVENRINRNIVECKFDSQIDALEKYCELIETLWNVNWGANAYAKKRISELIETLWNVNQHHLSQHTLHI